MFSQAQFVGGAEYYNDSANRTLGLANGRWITDDSVGAGTVTYTLPDPAVFRSTQKGYYFTFYRKGAKSVVVKNSAGTTIVTLSAVGQVAKVYIVNLTTNKWVSRIFTANTARSLTHGTRSLPTNPTIATAVNPSCFVGSPCEIARAVQTVPLDGQSGRPKVILPMYEDPVAHMKNAAREVIRAADLVMPSNILLYFTASDFTKDTNHPLNATTLSSEFYTALDNSGNPFIVPYSARTTTQQSHHWHHARSYLDWYAGDGSPAYSTVTRDTWLLQVPYTVSSTGATYTLEIRVVTEFTSGCDPTLAGAGGVCAALEGAWGAICNIHVFTNELNPAWIDGTSTYVPTGGAVASTFTRANPCVWSATNTGQTINSGSFDRTEKFFHPQLVISASTPMSFHCPMGSDYVPPQDRDYVADASGQLTVPMKNKLEYYRTINGTPWITGSCGSTCGWSSNAHGNVVFSGLTASNGYAGIALGGGFPKSKFTEWLCFENGLGTGRTYLKPAKAGWDETCGTFNILNGSSGSIYICTEDFNGIDDGSGHYYWPGFSFNACQGHPAELYNSVGGSHECLRISGAPGLPTKFGCINTAAFAHATIGQRCRGEWDLYDVDGTWLDSGEELTAPTQLAFLLALKEYNIASQSISFNRYIQDPAHVYHHYTFNATDVGSLVQPRGTWNFSGTTATTATVTSAPQRAVLYYDSSSDIIDSEQTVELTQARSRAAGLGARIDSGGTWYYYASINTTGGNNATLKIEYYQNGVLIKTVATKNITNLTSDNVTLKYTVWGSRHTLQWTISGVGTDSITGEDCNSFSSGYCALWSSYNGGGTVFNNWVITDKTIDPIEAIGDVTSGGIFFTAHANMHPLTFTCDGTLLGTTVGGKQTFFTPDGEANDGFSQGIFDSAPYDIPSFKDCRSTEQVNPTYPGGPDPVFLDCLCRSCGGVGGLPCTGLPSFVNCSFIPPITCHYDRANQLNYATGMINWFYGLVSCA